MLHNAFAIDYTQWLESLLDTLSDEMIEYDARDNEAGDLVTYQATLGEYVGSLEDSDHFDSIYHMNEDILQKFEEVEPKSFSTKLFGVGALS